MHGSWHDSHLPCCIKLYLSNILKLNLNPVHRITRSYGFRAAKLSAWYPASASLTTSELFFSSRFSKCFCVVRYSFLFFFFPPCSTRWMIAIFSSLASNNPSRDFNWYVSSRSLFTALRNKRTGGQMVWSAAGSSAESYADKILCKSSPQKGYLYHL